MTGNADSTKVAIACQGGGSHTAFTAGVLQHLLAKGEQDVVALSGTSGGAICALLTWYGLAVGGTNAAVKRLEGFWQDNAARSFFEMSKNDSLVALAQLQEIAGVPTISPYDYPEFARHELATLLRGRVDFDDVAALQTQQDAAPTDLNGRRLPLLLVGAVDVRSGKHKLFSSRLPGPGDSSSTRERFAGHITLDAILASAAVPPLFRAVHTQGSWFWDGLFSQNPPVRDLVDTPDPRPEELWVIRINPKGRTEEPTTIAEILDRRNELSGNLSLEQELYFIRKVNEWVEAGALNDDYRTVALEEIALEEDLTLASKLNRDARFIENLMAQGRLAAEAFLDRRRRR